MSVYKEHLKLQSHGGTPSYINVTPQVRAAIENSGIKEGICVVISPHTTCGVFFEEFVHDITPEGDEFLQADLNDVLKKIIPDHTDASQFRYPGPEHFRIVRTWPNAADYLPDDDISDLYNGDAHLKATVIGARPLRSRTASSASARRGMSTSSISTARAPARESAPSL